MEEKRIAAIRAASYVANGMCVGLGTGSTAKYAVLELGRRVQQEGLQIQCIATSRASHDLALELGIPLVDWDSVRKFDITIDGADEVDPSFRLIKGGGGALMREKIVASATATQIIVVDRNKLKPFLGTFPLPVAVVPFGWQYTKERLSEEFCCEITVRATKDGQTFVSDDNLMVLDMHFNGPLPDPDTFDARLKTIVGVVESGLFVGLCHRVIVGNADSTVLEIVPGETEYFPSA